MKDRYGEKDGTSAFYGTAAKNKMRPEDTNDNDADDAAPAPKKRKSMGEQLRSRSSY